MTIFNEIERDAKTGTQELGGWSWFGGRDRLYLATNQGGRRYVMDFSRKGMKGAQPRFQVSGEMCGAVDELTQYEVGDGSARGQKQADADPTVYRLDVSGVDHPDARRIANVPRYERAIMAAKDLADAVENYCANIPDMERWNVMDDALAAFREASQ